MVSVIFLMLIVLHGISRGYKGRRWTDEDNLAVRWWTPISLRAVASLDG